MSMHIMRFIDRIKAAESRGQQDMIISLRDARDLHADITKLLMRLQQNTTVEPGPDQEIEIRGGSF